MSDAWFEWHISPDGATEDGCDPLEAKALQDYFEHKTTPAEAAFAITRPITKDPQWIYNIGRLWGLIIDAFMDFDAEKRAQTITLIKEIYALPPFEDPNGGGYGTLGRFGFYWWEDAKFSQDWRKSSSDAATQEESREFYLKAAAREAELVESGIEDVWVNSGLVCIADALESSQAVLDVEIPAVYQWVTIAGNSIKAAVDNGEVKIWEGIFYHVSPMPRDLYKASATGDLNAPLDQARLVFWIHRLRSIATMTDTLAPKTREYAITSAEIMSEWVGAAKPSA